MSLRRNKHRFSAEVGASSMSDIMFFLMLFFLIVSTLVNPSVIKLLLPKASSVQTLSKQQFTIDISKDQEIYLNNQPIAFANLESQLKILTGGVQDATVVLRVDNSLTVQDLVDVLEIGNRLKLRMVMAAKTTK